MGLANFSPQLLNKRATQFRFRALSSVQICSAYAIQNYAFLWARTSHKLHKYLLHTHAARKI